MHRLAEDDRARLIEARARSLEIAREWRGGSPYRAIPERFEVHRHGARPRYRAPANWRAHSDVASRPPNV